MANITLSAVIGLVLAKWAVELWLLHLNHRHVLAHAGAVPEAFKGTVDEQTYTKSVQYTLAKGQLDGVETTFDAALLLLILWSGVLPGGYALATRWLGQSVWAMAGVLFIIAAVLTLPGLPFDWYHQFRLEERFGFNTTSQRVWWADRLKGLVLAVALGYPLLALVLKLVNLLGRWWWLWAWATLLAFQLLMSVLAPVLILPLFNKFTPLPEGSLCDRLLRLAERTRFRARSIQVMDGSKRSRHSNAFFTGFGRFRKIVLFDTLLAQLAETELEAVLAHEIGHFKKKHIPKMLLISALGSLAGLFAVSLLASQDWFYHAFGFAPGNIAPALLLFGLLAGAVTFWFSPLVRWWSRRYEYQSDAFAAEVIKEPGPLVTALRKLNEKNLSNLTPHPVYSGFYYSHPTLLERERALLGDFTTSRHS